MRSRTTPATLQSAIQHLIKESGTPIKKLRSDYRRMQAILADGANVGGATRDYIKKSSDKHEILQYGPREALTYAAAIMPGRVAIGQRVLAELGQRYPAFQPRTMLDFGTGTGANIWSAALEYPAIERFTAIDSSESMLNCARALIDFQATAVDTAPVIDGSKVQLERFLPASFAAANDQQQQGYASQERFDIVMCSSVLSELPSDPIRAMILRSLWRLTGDVLVLVEPGTAEGYRNVINARHMLLEQEAEASNDSVSVLAPCTHSRSCPMTTMTSTPDGSEAPLTLQRWCWFEQRLDRPKFLMQLKQASGSYEDHPFSYVIISRNNCYAGTTGNGNGNEHSFADARIIEPPTKRKRHVNVQLCTEEGKLVRCQLVKSTDPVGFTAARKAGHGDLVRFCPLRLQLLPEDWKPKGSSE